MAEAGRLNVPAAPAPRTTTGATPAAVTALRAVIVVAVPTLLVSEKLTVVRPVAVAVTV